MQRHFVGCLLALVAAFLSGCGNAGSTFAAPPPATPPPSVTVKFPVADLPTLAAYRAGSRGWVKTTISPEGTFSFSLGGASTYGVAYSCADDLEEVVELTASDSLSPDLQCPSAKSQPTGKATISVDASSIPGTASVLTAAGDVNYSYSINSTGARASGVQVSVTNPEDFDVAVEALDASSNILALKILRNVSGDQSITLTSSEDEIKSTQPFSVTGTQGEFPNSLVQYITSANRLAIPIVNSNGTYAVVPAASSVGGDLYDGYGAEINPHPRFYVAVGGQERIFATPHPEEFYPEYPWPVPVASPSALPAVTITGGTITPSLLGGYMAGVSWQYSEFVFASSAYVGGAASLQVPDLSDLGFYPNAPAGTRVYYYAGAFDNSKYFALPNLTWGGYQPLLTGLNISSVNSNTTLTAYAQYFFTVP